MRIHIAAVALLAAAYSAHANADFDLKAYRELSEAEPVKEKISSYVTGVGRGILYTSIYSDAAGNQPLFCMPPRLALDEGLIRSLLDQEIRSPHSGQEYPDNAPIELILLRAFVTRFPCESEPN